MIVPGVVFCADSGLYKFLSFSPKTSLLSTLHPPNKFHHIFSARGVSHVSDKLIVV